LDIIICNNCVNLNNSNNSNNSKTWTLIDFKCSESEFRLEWQLQLLTYYSLIKLLDLYLDIQINRMGIINIMDGKEYYFDIPNDYDFVELIGYWEEKINLDQQSLRLKPDLNLFLSSNIIKHTGIDNIQSGTNNELITTIKLEVNKVNKNNLMMVLDTETSDFNGDIIQLAYVIVDLDNNNYNKIIKTFDKIIKDRIPSTNSTKIHNITIEKIRTNGVDFIGVVKEFINDLAKVNMILGHNISFDLRIVINNLRKFSIQITNKDNLIVNNIFAHLDIICTRKLSGGKSLENLHLELFGEKVSGAHDALNDVRATLDCYIELMKKENIKKTIIQQDLFV
jgi:DNA polymerase III epsilon subunit-like protein